MSETLLRPRRTLGRADILPPAAYAAIRDEERRRISAIKRDRRLEVGSIATFTFENFATMQHQVQEMLHIEKGGERQVAEELAAYAPLVPQGHELIATVMFEIADPARRAARLRRLGGIERRVFLDVAGERVCGLPDPHRENTSPEGKASAVQFITFLFSDQLISRFKAPGTRVFAGFDHSDYGHIAVMPEPMRAALAEDFD
ncbi:MAG: DUF3501 family protein [Stellaceae bacterium]